MELGLNLKQTLTIAPQTIANLEVLQMGSQQLLDYIQKLAEENPTVELQQSYSEKSVDEQFVMKLRWLREMDSQNKIYYKYDSDLQDPFATVLSESETLSGHLIAQLGETALPDRLKKAAAFIALSLDGSGWLTEAPEALAPDSGFSAGELAGGLAVVQDLDPAGVGASDLRSCLLLQLKRRGGDSALARRIVEGYLPEVASKSLTNLSRLLNEPEEKVEKACALIRSLNPRPSSGFSGEESTVYITPDVIVVGFQDHFELLTNDYFFPTMSISGYYLDLLKTSGDLEVKKYLEDKVRQARQAAKSIDQRKSMLLRCAEHIVSRQETFFRGGSLVPMTMADLAQALEVHESTVSRAVKDKFLQCSRGVFAMNRFFTRALGSEVPASPDQARELIRSVVSAEDPAAPYSDNRLSELLAREGVEISRRTVAKYRLEMGIPSATVRRGTKMNK